MDQTRFHRPEQGAGMRAGRSVAAWLALAILLFGVPWVIVRWGEWQSLAAVARDPSLLLAPDDGHIVLGLVTVIAIAGYLLLAWSIIVEIAATARDRSTAGRPETHESGGLLSWSRHLVRPLVSAAFALILVSGHTAAALADSGPATPIVSVTPNQPVTYQPAELSPLPPPPHPALASPTIDTDLTTTNAEPATPLPTITGVQADTETVYIVSPGDSLWSIAEKVYGDGQAWRRIAEANDDLLLGSDLLETGWQLRLPDAEAAQAGPTKESAETIGAPHGKVTVQPGDSLWSIAQSTLGDGERWEELVQANTSLIQDPRSIEPGWELALPTPSGIAAPTSNPTDSGPTESSHQTAPGSTDPGLTDPSSTATGPTPGPTGPAEPGSTDSDPVATMLPTIHPDSPRPIAEPTTISPSATATHPVDSTTAPTPSSTGGNSEPTAPPPATLAPTIAMTPTPDATTATEPAASQPHSVDEATPRSDSSTPLASPDKPGELTPAVIVGTSAVLAGGLAFMLRRRRLANLRARPVGRRITHPDDSGKQLEIELNLVGSQAPISGSITSRLEAILAHATMPEDGLTVNALPFIHSPSTANVEPPSPGFDLFGLPTAGVQVCLGEDDTGQPVFVDVSGGRPFLITAPQAHHTQPVIRGVTLNLALDEWSAETDLHLASGGSLFDTFDGIERHADFEEAATNLSTTVASRRRFLGDQRWDRLQHDPNLGEAWRPAIYCFVEPISEAEFCDLAERLEGPDVGVCVIAAMQLETPELSDTLTLGRLQVESPDQAVIHPGSQIIRPLSLDPPEPVQKLLAASADHHTTDAWWFSSPDQVDTDPMTTDITLPTTVVSDHDESEPSMTPVTLQHRPPELTPMTTFSHPTLKLLGPILLEGAQGTAPVRAERACMEYCGWLLEHPGTTATAMAQGLLVAEGTRRSNMSRLRTWLGFDHEGNPYLPEAYSGRIWLDAAVSSDWQRLCLLIATGVESSDLDKLVQALHLVRGAPLADASPGQWHWAEEMRTDMMSVIRDIGVVATTKLLAIGDIDRARWTASRALIAAPEDELLLCARVRTEHVAGNRTEVERLVTWITRNARNLGIDLLPETVTTLQEVIGTRPRPRLVTRPKATQPPAPNTDQDSPEPSAETTPTTGANRATEPEHPTDPTEAVDRLEPSSQTSLASPPPTTTASGTPAQPSDQ